jgi:PAS domain S-box-containing protein
MDMDLNFEYLSPSSEKLLGYEINERLKISLDDIYTQESMQKIKNSISIGIENYNKNKIITNYYAEPKGKHKKGHFINIEVIAKLVVDENGQITGIQGASRDITDRKNTEKEIHKLKNAIEKSNACITITDVNGIIEYANPFFTTLTRYAPNEYLGKNITLIVSDVHNKEFHDNLWQTIKSGITWVLPKKNKPLKNS